MSEVQINARVVLMIGSGTGFSMNPTWPMPFITNAFITLAMTDPQYKIRVHRSPNSATLTVFPGRLLARSVSLVVGHTRTALGLKDRRRVGLLRG
jgi:hypothetical protein